MGFSAFSRDLRKVSLANRWESADTTQSGKVRTIQLKLTAHDQGSFEITNPEKFSVFIDRQLQANNTKQIKWLMDSLKARFVFPVTVTIFCKEGTSHFNIYLLIEDHNQSEIISGSGHSNAILIVSILLIWVLIMLLSVSNALYEYLNLKNIFTLRMLEESGFSQKVTSFNNIFVYCFCSLLAALVITISGSDAEFNPDTAEALLKMFRIFLWILIFLLSKILITSLISRMFGLTEFAPSQFFNFLKFALNAFILIAFLLVFFFIIGLDKSILREPLKIFGGTMWILFVSITLLRLRARRGRTVFHLFSYLCISEVFPVLILFRIYY